MNRVEKSIQLHKKGYCCAQAVFCTFTDIMNIDESTAIKLTQPLCSGISTLREVCGAVSGMSLVLGIIFASDNPTDKDARNSLYQKVKQLANEFNKENGSLNCGVLLGLVEDKNSTIKKKPCIEYICYCVELLEKCLTENNIIIDK